MAHQRRKISAKEEQDLVTGMIVSERFLQHVVPILRPELLQNQYAVTVARWCQDFFQQYDKAPYTTIQDIFASEREGMDPVLADQVALFLERLSERYASGEDAEHFNADYHIDNAERYLKRRSLSALAEKVDGFLAREMVLEAEAEVSTYRRVERPTGEGVSVFDDKDAIISAFAEDTDEELFYFPGDLGKAVGPMCRDDLVAIAGPAKRGKTWWLIWVAILAVTSKLNVVFFSLEMTERQMLRRIFQSLLGETKRKTDDPVNVPEFDEEGRISMRPAVKAGVNGQDALKKKRALKRLTRGAKLKLVCVPAYSMSVAQMGAHLDNMEYFDGFVPDVIVCDYADILRPETKGDHRNLIDESWRALRALAQRRHCLVVTGTHSGRATFTRDMGQADITEDIRKLNHVACMIGLNEDKDDRDAGCMRVVTLAQRHEGAGQEVTVLKCLDIGKPYLDSRFSVNVRRDT
jgi:hypothetical protein